MKNIWLSSQSSANYIPIKNQPAPILLTHELFPENIIHLSKFIVPITVMVPRTNQIKRLQWMQLPGRTPNQKLFVYSITQHSQCALLLKYFIFVNYNGLSNCAELGWAVNLTSQSVRPSVSSVWRSPSGVALLVGLIKITRTPFWWRNESAVEMGDGRKISNRKWLSWEF